jgi:hypothetical protein
MDQFTRHRTLSNNISLDDKSTDESRRMSPSSDLNMTETLPGGGNDNNGGNRYEVPVWVQQMLQQQQNALESQQAQYQQQQNILVAQQTQYQQQQTQIQHLTALLTNGGTNTNTPANADRTTTQASDTKRPRAKLPDTEKFTSDDLSLYPQFEGKLLAKLEIDKNAIGEEKDRIWYAFNRLEGKAATRIFPWMTTYRDTAKFTENEFFKQLRVAFRDPSIHQKAIIKLNTLRQGNRSFNDLVSEFDRLLLEAGGHAWDDMVKKGYLRASFNPILLEKLITVPEEENYEQFCKQVKAVADKLVEYKRVTSNAGTHPRGTPITGTKTAPDQAASADTMDWEPTSAKNSKRAKWVSKEELEKRRKDGLCLRCGSSYHRIAACPYQPARRPQTEVKIAKIDAKDAVLEEETESTAKIGKEELKE